MRFKFRLKKCLFDSNWNVDGDVSRGFPRIRRTGLSTQHPERQMISVFRSERNVFFFCGPKFSAREITTLSLLVSKLSAHSFLVFTVCYKCNEISGFAAYHLSRLFFIGHLSDLVLRYSGNFIWLQYLLIYKLTFWFLLLLIFLYFKVTSTLFKVRLRRWVNTSPLFFFFLFS